MQCGLSAKCAELVGGARRHRGSFAGTRTISGHDLEAGSPQFPIGGVSIARFTTVHYVVLLGQGSFL